MRRCFTAVRTMSVSLKSFGRLREVVRTFQAWVGKRSASSSQTPREPPEAERKLPTMRTELCKLSSRDYGDCEPRGLGTTDYGSKFPVRGGLFDAWTTSSR